MKIQAAGHPVHAMLAIAQLANAMLKNSFISFLYS